MSAVQLIELGLSFGTQQVLRNCNLRVESGEYLVILGESGGGKTSLLRAIAGLEPLSSGQILLSGRDAAGIAPRNRDVSLVPQQDGLYPHLSVLRSIEIGIRGRLPATEKRRQAMDAAKTVGIERLLQRLPQELSGGERRRAAVAKAIACGAAIRLLDEPLSAVDTGLRFQIEQDLLQLHRSKKGVTIHVTHDGGVAMRLADRVAVLDGGKIVQCDTPENVYRSPASVSVASALGRSPFRSFLAVRDGMHWETEHGIRIQAKREHLGDEVIIGYYSEDVHPQASEASGVTDDLIDHRKQTVVRAKDIRWIFGS